MSSLAATALVLPLLTGLGPAAAGQPSQAPAEEAIDDHTATVSITEVSPEVPDEDDTLTIRGTLTNDGSSPIQESSVAARQPVALSSREAMDEAMARTGFGNTVLDGAIVRNHGQDIGTIEPGMSRTFVLHVPVSELTLGEDGVYQLEVSLLGHTEDRQWDQNLGIGRTLLPWHPDGSGAALPTKLTVLWPLISTTHLTSNTGSDATQTPEFLDDSLLSEISPGGRLYEMVKLGAELPVTWVVDPDLLASVDAMTEGYLVPAEEGDELVAGTGQDEARAFLLALRNAVRDQEVVALPFGDPDVASLAHRGEDVRGALGHFTSASAMAADTVETVLDVTPSTDYAWPVEGALDPEIVSVATSAGADHVIARSDSLRPGDISYTPNAVRSIGGGTSAIVADAGLSTLFEGDMSRTGSAALAQQELLAQTLAITGEAPSEQRSIVLAPQRMPTAAQADAMAAALTTLEEQAGWVELTGLSDAAAAEPDPAANHRVPSARDYPERLRDQELPTSAYQFMRETNRTLDDFTVILSQPDRVAAPVGNAIRREMSTSWRDDSEAAEAYRTAVQSDLDDLIGQVHLVQKSPITLSGRSATIPVTVQNNLVQDVQGLELRLTSSRSLSLQVDDAEDVAISGGHSQSVKLSATARSNGKTVLQAQLFTADGTPLGEPMTFQADVTSITSAVMMVIAGGLLLVVLAGIRMYTQRKRAARISGSEDPEAGAPAGETPADTDEESGSTLPESEKLGRND
ncbi:hypothetical protein D7294_30135 [Streptomyces hoynatensis]|uniref:Glycoprotein n=1 Tax=Streptomyces hoynatensis TaxID=1141874 RepID=A0A3A9YMY5_9ACTN|nr:hypothetical protein D7294_30135 [Streptomyces hoynatensis]